jgi:polysaccharide export outer membrane protein
LRDLIYVSMIAVLTANLSVLSASAADTPPVISGAVNSSYVLGPGDVLTIWALGADEISAKPYTILPDGSLDLPLVGRVTAGGKSVDDLKRDLEHSLAQYFRTPQVSVSVTDFRSQPVSVLGCVNEPGVHQLQGGKNLLEVLSLAGGVAPEADSTVMITRRAEWGPIPVPDSKKDASGLFYVAKVDIQEASEGKNPQNNIRIFPNDVVQVSKARMVYVLGEVSKPGGYVLHQDENVSAVQALSMAGGPTNYGNPKNAMLSRSQPGSKERLQSKIDLKQILDGKGEDTLLRADDIIYVPGNMSKAAGIKALQMGAQVVTGLIIWHH